MTQTWFSAPTNGYGWSRQPRCDLFGGRPISDSTECYSKNGQRPETDGKTEDAYRKRSGAGKMCRWTKIPNQTAQSDDTSAASIARTLGKGRCRYSRGRETTRHNCRRCIKHANRS